MLPAISEALLGHLSAHVLLERGRHTLHMVAKLVFQYSGMGSFGFIFSSYQKLPLSCFFSHVGNALVTVDEMQRAELWQL